MSSAFSFDAISWAVFVQALFILLREGLETVLILSALAAALRQTDTRAPMKALYSGMAAGLLVGIFFAFLLAVVLHDLQSQIIEGTSLLIAVVLMVYVSGWLLWRQDPRAMIHELKTRATEALKADHMGLAIALLGFVTVLRESVETAIFYDALAEAEGGWSGSLFLGLGVAVLGLGAFFMAFRTMSIRVPLRPLFVGTSLLLLVMALKFLGDGIGEFQEIAWVPEWKIEIPDALVTLGIGQTVQTLGAQIILLALAAASLFIRWMSAKTALPS